MSEEKKPIYYQDWTKILVPRLRNSTTWNDLFQGISEVFADQIYSKIYALSKIRDSDFQSKEINIRSAKFLGLDYNSDLFTETEYQTLVKFLNIFNRQYKGTKSFVAFLGWIKQAKFQIYQLWAKGQGKDYGEFSRLTPYIKKNSKIDGTGTKEYYPTSHVELDYDAEKFDISIQDIYSLFYAIAPAHLVLANVAGILTSDTIFFYMKPAYNDYNAGHTVIPCIYQYIAPIYFLAKQGQLTSYQSSAFESFGYQNDNEFTTTKLPGFEVIPYISNKLSSNFKFTRKTIASYYPCNSEYFKIAEDNQPRFDFERNSITPNGLFLEKGSSNLLLDSSNPRNRQLTLQVGPYTFSGHGTYDIIINDNKFQTVSDSSITFNLDRISVVKVIPTYIPGIQPWFQLEKGTLKTSYIETTPLHLVSRDQEILELNSFPNPNKTCTLLVKFKDIAEHCNLILARNVQGDFTRIDRNGNKILITCSLYQNPILIEELPYKPTLIFGISKEMIKVNGKEFNILNKNAPIPQSFLLNSIVGKELNGYVKSLSYFPVI